MEEKKALSELQKRFSGNILDASAPFGDETVVIPKDALLEIAEFLRNPPFSFTMLLDLTCVDYPDRRDRFEMVYHLFSLTLNERIRIKLALPESAASVASLTGLWKNADWLEREAFDMFGVRFDGHPDLRRLFMDEGFAGHPLRKDFPLRKRQPRIAPRT